MFYLNIRYTDSRFYELEDIHDGRLKKKKFSSQKFLNPFNPFEVKKGPKFELFSQKKQKSVIFGQNQILFFLIVSHW